MEIGRLWAERTIIGEPNFFSDGEAELTTNSGLDCKYGVGREARRKKKGNLNTKQQDNNTKRGEIFFFQK